MTCGRRLRTWRPGSRPPRPAPTSSPTSSPSASPAHPPTDPPAYWPTRPLQSLARRGLSDTRDTWATSSRYTCEQIRVSYFKPYTWTYFGPLPTYRCNPPPTHFTDAWDIWELLPELLQTIINVSNFWALRQSMFDLTPPFLKSCTTWQIVYWCESTAKLCTSESQYNREHFGASVK